MTRDERPVVLVAIEPALLESTLGHLFSARGWNVMRSPAPSASIDAAVVSRDRVAEAGCSARLVVVLPDESGTGGSLTRGDRPSEPFLADVGGLKELVELLPAAISA